MMEFGVRQANSGYRIAYRQNQANHCPGCGQSHWVIGRASAECAFCGTALPLVAGGNFGPGLMRVRGFPGFNPATA